MDEHLLTDLQVTIRKDSEEILVSHTNAGYSTDFNSELFICPLERAGQKQGEMRTKGRLGCRGLNTQLELVGVHLTHICLDHVHHEQGELEHVGEPVVSGSTSLVAADVNSVLELQRQSEEGGDRLKRDLLFLLNLRSTLDATRSWLHCFYLL